MTDLKTAWYADHAPGRGVLKTVPPFSSMIDGTPQQTIGGAGNTFNKTLTTTLSNTRIVAAVIYEDRAITSITSPTLTFTHRKTIDDPSGGVHADIWTAPAASPLTDEVITLTYGDPGVNHMFMVFAIKTGTLSATLPVGVAQDSLDNGAGNTPSVTTASTTGTTYNMLYAVYGFDEAGAGGSSLPAGFTAILDSSAFGGAGYKIVYGVQSGITITCSIASDPTTSWAIIADSLTL